MSTVADAVVTFNTGRDRIVLTLAAVAVDWMEAGITTPVWDAESREIDPDAWIELQERLGAEMKCPYEGCTFAGTQEEVDDHVSYCVSIDDADHREDKRRA